MFKKSNASVLVAEFIATFMLTAVVLGVSSRSGFPFFIAIGAGLTVGLMVLLLGPVSGAHANSAITLGLWTKDKIRATKAVAYIAAQVAGATVALASYQYMIDKAIERPTQYFDWRAFTAEAIGAGIFGFGIAAAINLKLSGGQLATAIGSSLTLGILVASAGSNAILNPAVAIGVDSIGWAYILGPVAGAVVGMHLYGAFFENTPQVKSKKKR